jgi:hypothetical protein
MLDPSGLPVTVVEQIAPTSQDHNELMCASQQQPTMPAYETMYSLYNYNCNPLMLLGSKIVEHKQPAQQASWDPHSKLGWYIGPALEHSRCHQCYIVKTNSESISDTVEFFPHQAILPKLTIQEVATTTPMRTQTDKTTS